MFNYINARRGEITRELSTFLSAKESELAAINSWGPDASRRIHDFTATGKMIRGALILFAHDLCAGTNPAGAMRAACAIELLQSYLLIHDDIMDRDYFRRGNPAVFHQYTLHAEAGGMHSPERFGEAMGICAGDVAIFLATELIGEAATDFAMAKSLNTLFSREMVLVGLGQMQDIHFGHARTKATREEVLKLYTFKTSRYTFSLPLMAGALLAGDADKARLLEEIGINLGIIFQIKDDELGLFGTSEEIGKVAGSDIREGKMTLFMTELMPLISGEDLERFTRAFGSETVSDDDISFIRVLVKESGAYTRAMDEAKRRADETRRQIAALGASDDYTQSLLSLLEYNLTRKK